MFTGIIESRVRVAACEPLGGDPQGLGARGVRLRLPRPSEDWDVSLGESVAVSGVCLTVAALDADGAMSFDVSAETLARTWFTDLGTGRWVNLERALAFGERLGGHLVSGHVDGVGSIAAIEDSGDGGKRFSFEVPAELEAYLIDKGSIAVDGISLTVVEPRGALFDVAVIPLTLSETHLGEAAVGDRVNLEGDMVGKWIAHLVDRAR